MIKPQKIDLSESEGGIVADANLVVRRLKSDGLYKPNLMYRGFNGEDLSIMLKYGTDIPDSDMIYCGDENELREGDDMSALKYAYYHSNPALAVYDGSKLTDSEESYEKKRFIDSQQKLDALIAVYLLPKGEY